jgi:hypothetical protein
MPELSEGFINDDAYSSTSFTTEWINCSSANNLTFTSYCSEAYDVGVRWAVDSNFFVISETTVNKLAGENHDLFVPVITRFVQFFVSNIASTPAELRCQGFFYIPSSGIFDAEGGASSVTLSNAGTGNSLVVGSGGPNLSNKSLTAGTNISFVDSGTDITISSTGGTTTLTSAGGSESLVVDGTGPTLSIKGLSSGGTVSLASDANSVTINGASTDVSLTNAGGGTTLINDGVGPSLATKSITGGTNIVLNDTGTDITINSTAGGSSVFQQTGAQIEPITATQTSCIGGLTNTIDITTETALVWGENNYTYSSANKHFNVGVIASETCGITGAAGGNGRNMGAIFCKDCKHITSGGNGDTLQVGFIASELCDSHDGGGGDRSCQRCATIAAYNCRIGGINSVTRDSLSCLIASSQNCDLDNYSGTCCSTIMSCDNCSLGTVSPGAADADQLCIIGSKDCTLGNDNSSRYRDCILSSNSSTITSQSFNNIIINGDGSHINGADNTVIIGKGITGAHDGNFLCSDSQAGFSSGSIDQCIFKYNNGYVFYTNNTLTSGIQALAGAGSWSSICDVNKKENLKELDYKEVLDKLDNLPIFQFNYKGNPRQQINYSPTAQNYHKLFTDEKLNDKHTKDQLSIESMDLLGLCVCGIKALKEIADKQQVEINKLKSTKTSTTSTTSSASGDVLLEIKKLKDRVRILELQN